MARQPIPPQRPGEVKPADQDSGTTPPSIFLPAGRWGTGSRIATRRRTRSGLRAVARAKVAIDAGAARRRGLELADGLLPGVPRPVGSGGPPKAGPGIVRGAVSVSYTLAGSGWTLPRRRTKWPRRSRVGRPPRLSVHGVHHWP